MPNNKEIVVEVTEEQHNQQLADGLLKDEILSVGKHTFKRGGFHQRHPNFKSKDTKTRINICIDSDILQHFRNRAENPNAAPYQTQINAELRAIMEKDLANNAPLQNNVEDITKNKEFVRAVAEQLKELLAA
jgi:uncharacterized protein (DUF4415 family)